MRKNITKSLVTLSSIVFKMASQAKNSRKPNFAASEISVLTEKYEENMEILQNKFTNSITNAKKKSGLGGYCCSRKRRRSGPKDYTRNQGQTEEPLIQSAAKKEFSGFRKEQKKTGGGPTPPKPSEATLKIIEIFSETPFFTGLQGFETGKFAGGNVYFCGYLKCNEKRIPYRLQSFTLAVLRILLREDKKKETFLRLCV